MKSHHLILSATLPAIFAICWTAYAAPTSPELAKSTDEAAETSPSVKDSAAISRMEAAQALIGTRLGMSAPMEIEKFDGRDPVDDLVASGFIVDATLEEVESALAAAAATSDLEDDKRALDLKHRGSYRFFAP